MINHSEHLILSDPRIRDASILTIMLFYFIFYIVLFKYIPQTSTFLPFSFLFLRFLYSCLVFKIICLHNRYNCLFKHISTPYNNSGCTWRYNRISLSKPPPHEKSSRASSSSRVWFNLFSGLTPSFSALDNVDFFKTQHPRLASAVSDKLCWQLSS